MNVAVCIDELHLTDLPLGNIIHPMTLENEKLLLSGGLANDTLFERGLEISGADDPKLLFDFSGIVDSSQLRYFTRQYTQFFRNEFGIGLTLNNFLQNSSGKMPPHRTENLVADADILVAGPGSTQNLLATWQDTSIGKLAIKRLSEGDLTVIGLGAGSAIWFDQTYGDYRRYHVEPGLSWQIMLTPTLGVLEGVVATKHADNDNMGRLMSQSFSSRLGRLEGWQRAYGINSTAAIVCADGIANVLALQQPQKIYEPKPTVTYYTPGNRREEYVDGEPLPLSKN